MILVVADIHFGKDRADAERRKERELIACIETCASESGNFEELILLGDVFEKYIEYRHVVPKGFSRFLGLLGRLADAGVAITYFAGNHDPWHRDYFSTEFGARFVADEEIRTLGEDRYYFFHGDGAPQNGGLYRKLKPIIRHPLPVAAYTSILPADVGMALASWVNRRFGSHERSARTIAGLRQMAADLVANDVADVVVMGHSHQPELTSGYLNPGSWHYQRTFAMLTSDGPQLAQWTHDRIQPGIHPAEPTWPTGPTQTKNSIAISPTAGQDDARMDGESAG